MTMIRLIQMAKELGEGKPAEPSDILRKIPFIETEWPDGRTGADNFRNLESPRFMKTHLPYELWKDQLDKHPNLTVIQTVRNPKDALVSYFHHLRSDCQLGAFHGNWDHYFELFKEKKLPWGDYFENTSNWYKFNKDRKESLVLVYEDMKKSHRDHVIKIANFLGHDDISDNVVDLIVEKSSMKVMSKSINTAIDGFPAWKSERSNLIRKGEVGDWVNYFSEEQSKYIDAKCEKYCEPLGLKFDHGNVDK